MGCFCNHRGPCKGRGRQEEQSQKEAEDALMLALKMEEGVTGQIQSFLEAVRGKGMDSSLKAWKNEPC